MSGWQRVPAHRAITDIFPNARCWQKDVEDGHLTVLRTIERETPETPWYTHISISHRTNENPPKPGRYPTWDEQVEAVHEFAPGKRMASYIVPEAEHVNYHPTTFHWWEAPDYGQEVRHGRAR